MLGAPWVRPVAIARVTIPNCAAFDSVTAEARCYRAAPSTLPRHLSEAHALAHTITGALPRQ
jgi:hypothetical protein